MKLHWMIGAAALTLLSACGQTTQTDHEPNEDLIVTDPVGRAPDAGPAPEIEAVVDYSYLPNWLCHPDKADSDACSGDLTTTIVHAGHDEPLTGIEPHQRAEDPGIDCFYVYPTVSTDPGGNSDMEPNEAELRVTYVQFARFSAVCRQYAPVYRQITLKGLSDMMAGTENAFDPVMGYKDIQNAWEYYLEHENNGRGVILIGHSQGANMLQLLLANDIIGKPAEDLIISAMPIGYTIPVDRETQSFEGMPLCSSKDQTGCMISYVSFRAEAPPPPTSWFGLSLEEGKQAACVNPGALTGDGMLKPYLSNAIDTGGNAPHFAGKDVKITTPFGSLPGMLTAECVEAGPHTYLAITTHADPDDPRTDRVAGDVYANGAVLPDWGLHLGDMHLSMGNLVEIADAQGKAWVAAHPKE